MSLSPAQLLSPIVDPQTGLVTQGWGLWFQQFKKAQGSGGTPGVSTVFTPTVTALSGSLTSASASGRFLQFGKWCYLNVQASVTVNVGATPQQFEFSLPVVAASLATLSGYAEVAGSALPIVGSFIVATISPVGLVTFSTSNSTQYFFGISGIYETV